MRLGLGFVVSLIVIGTAYATGGLPAQLISNMGLAHDQNSFGNLDEFVYTIDAPAYVKQLADKEVEKEYEFNDVNQYASGIEVKASYVKLHFKTEPLESGTKIMFDVFAENLEIDGMGYNARRDSADISGYGILNEEATKLTVHIPWAEITKNL